MPAYPGFLGPTYQSASLLADRERLINWILEPIESPSTSAKYVLVTTPGFSTFASVAAAPIRGFGVAGARVFFVAGYALYELFANGTVLQRGTVSADTNPATISWNGPTGNALFITSGGVGYGYALGTNTLTANVTTYKATMGAFLSNRFLALDATTSTLQISNLQSTTFNPTQIAIRSARPDPWISMAVVNNEIWLWGTTSTDVWYDAGASPFPFQPIPNASFDQGIDGPFSANRDGVPLHWVGSNAQGTRIIWQAQGYQPVRVSTHAIEAQLTAMTNTADALGFTYQDRGHLFYVPIFPSADQAFHYDIKLGSAGWGERLYWNTTTASWQALRVGTHVYAFGRHLVGDRFTGTIYTMDPLVYTDVGGVAMRRLRQPPRLAFDQKRVKYTRLQIVMDTGIGLVSGQGSDPQVMLSSSNDGGRTFGAERWTSAGPIGAFNTRVQWLRLGQGRNRVDRVVVTDPVPWRIVDATLDYEVLVN